MILHYSKPCGREYYSEQTDECFQDEEDFEYEITDNQAEFALTEIFYDLYFASTGISKDVLFKSIRELVGDLNIKYEDYREDLEAYFADEALD